MARFMTEKEKFFYRVRCFFIPLEGKRVKFIRKHDLFAHFGNNVHFQPRLIPSDPQLVKIHDNVVIATGVNFVTHDLCNKVINGMKREGEKKIGQYLGCIEIEDNVSIGANTIILPNVKIGPNAIVGAGSVVTHDVEPNSVVVGVPARKIGNFDDFVKRHTKRISDIDCLNRTKEEKFERLWKLFDQMHEKTKDE